MTVKDLIEKLSQLNQDATVYTMAHDDDIALIATDVRANVLVGKEETVLIFLTHLKHEIVTPEKLSIYGHLWAVNFRSTI